MKLSKVIENSVNKVIQSQRSNGSMPPGHNGPYFDPETPVRNTAHWSVTFLKVYQISNNQDFLDAALKCGNYLLSNEARPMDSVFFCRKKPEKDFANGLVGQAWAIEALVALSDITDEQKYTELAERVFLMHPFNKKAAAWIRKNVDGSNNGFDSTFNHQLWFAAAGGLLADQNEEINKQVLHFLNAIESHIELYKDGCIKHKGRFLVQTPVQKLKYWVKFFRESNKHKKYMKMKSIGYHGFNLYGFALLKNKFPDHSFLSSDTLKRALNYAKSNAFKRELPNSKYGFPYNPPGFEIGYALQEFNEATEEEIADWVSWQIKTCFNFETYLMTEGDTKDSITQAARIYEATRLKNYELNLD